MERNKITDEELMEQVYQLRDRTYALVSEIKSAFDEMFHRTTDFIEQRNIKELKAGTLHLLDSAHTNYSEPIRIPCRGECHCLRIRNSNR